MAEKLEQSSAAAMAEELVGADDLNLAIESFKHYIGALKANDQRAVLRAGNHTIKVIKYAGGNRARPNSYETGFTMLPNSALVLDSMVQIYGLAEEADYASRFHTGDSHFFMSASAMAGALRQGAGLKNYSSASTKQMSNLTARKVVPLIDH